ncbi:hypothetical protein V496_06064 [Pseudogymnoascus sp. VKM F-4515 (FW-2607)]|nr:hypothetical protein V496_06064 [Pseudogymnoascus sp. VKM F-4515 (FW-2607)]
MHRSRPSSETPPPPPRLLRPPFLTWPARYATLFHLTLDPFAPSPPRSTSLADRPGKLQTSRLTLHLTLSHNPQNLTAATAIANHTHHYLTVAAPPSAAMGRTSKFFFPVPGRRASVLPSSKSDAAAPTPSSSSSSNTRPPPQRPQQPLSKAQRLLGTGDLNIDAPTRDDDGTWRSYTPSSTRSRAATSPSRMSIEIAESTTEDDAFSVSEGGVPPIRLNGKASSTLLGRGTTMRAEYGGEDMASDLPDIRSERSNSTLRSYYDRGSTPLAVSQQTSASSARDLALRKGYQPAISSMPHSPLGIDSIAEDDGSDDNRDRDNRDNRDSYYPTSPMQPPKKKTSRLDLTRLFHKKSKDSSLRPPTTSRTPSIASGVSSTTDAAYSRKLSKTPPAARKKSAVASPPVDRLRDEKTVQFQNDHHATDDLWDHYEQRAYVDRSPKPETARVAKAAAAAVPVIASPRPRHEAPNGVSYPDLRPRGGHDSRDAAAPPHSAWRARDHLGGNGQNWDATSRVSDSSKTTGTSRRSVFSNSNLQQNSILSLSESSSSDDDDGGGEEERGE